MTRPMPPGSLPVPPQTHRIQPGSNPPPFLPGLIALLTILATLDSHLSATETLPSEALYLSAVKPLLHARCVACHGALQQKARLRLDTAAAIVAGGKSGPALVRRDPSASLILTRISEGDPAARMPPEHEGEPLASDEIAHIREWIVSGAQGPTSESAEPDPRDHWSFRPLTRPTLGILPTNGPCRNGIDVWIAAAQQEAGLTPATEAPRQVLIRRLYFDLIGVPPNPADWNHWSNHPEPDWYERLVDQLLADPRYGERWGRHWMDIWRYSDWWGLGEQLRNSHPHLWHWRDWIVESLNADVPFDEMIRQMLAADELYPDDPSRLRATGYLARNYFLFNRNQWLEETVEHVSKGLLGLTLNCTKCHDHKYDPFSQEDFYRMRAFFEPYHVRVDMVPSEADLTRNGIARVFDGWPDRPTYRFVRGRENDPDKSHTIAPGVPALLDFAPFNVEPVHLPPTSTEPERHPWVFETHLTASHRKLQQAARVAAAAATSLQARLTAATQRQEQLEAQYELNAAEAALAVARAESQALERRIDAIRTTWAGNHASPTNPAHKNPRNDTAPNDANRTALLAEREAALARTRHAVATAALKWLRSKPEGKAAALKDLDAARTEADKRSAAAGTPPAPDERPTPVTGARWIPTRFLDSTRDDPAVSFPSTSTGRRRALAAWITDPRNPLTSRVAINHVWNRHFGSPLAPNVFDFGRKNPRPLHHPLIDWLASDWIEHGWSFKYLHRTLVSSAAYRRASSTSGHGDNLAHDPDNRYWWRRLPIRLESEAVRDSILSLADSLDLTQGGPPVPVPDQEPSHRRSLYFFASNNEQNLFLGTFDAANVKECYRREQTTIPQQALALLNSRLVRTAIAPIAARLATNPDESTFIRQAFRNLLGFDPSPAELDACRRTMNTWHTTTTASNNPPPGTNPTPREWLVWSLINHHDFVSLR